MWRALAPYQSGIIFLLVAAGFVALLLRDMGSGSQVQCSLCVEFEGRTQCATGQGVDQASALQSAQTVACAPLAGGPNQAFRCSAEPPRQVSCAER
jgi:hypothetical protein